MEVDVDAGGVAEGDFEGDVGRGGFGSQVGRFGTRPYSVTQLRHDIGD